jgi:Fe-S cluster assembly protein SufD
MVQSKSSQTKKYVDAQRKLESNVYSRDPNWMRALRADALSRFTELGFPTTRRGNEEWKYTDVRPIVRLAFSPTIEPADLAAVSADQLDRFTFGESTWHRIVFVDGRFRADLSSLERLSQDVQVTNLVEAASGESPEVQENLGRLAGFESDGFAALNTAFVHEGVYLHVSDRADLDEPIHIVFLLTSDAHEAVSQPRVLIVTGRDARATIVETYASVEGGTRSFTNAVTEMVVGPGSAINRYTNQLQNEETIGVATTHVEVHENANFTSVYTDIGGALIRNNLSVDMVGVGGHCTLNGSYIVSRKQHVDNQVIIDHKVGHTGARELYKGVLDGKSRSVFHGSIIVRQGAAKVDALQEDKNLLLSDEAEADTKPAFWIYCDDVRCGHGAACGAIDGEAVFYLRSRGLDEAEARQLLVRGFVAQIVDTITHEGVRRHVDRLVNEKLSNL